MIANPHVVSVCPVAQLALFECPADSQAGVVPLRLFGFGVFPLYRTVPQKGQAGLFAFTLPFGLAIPQYIAFTARTGGDYGLDVKTVGISHILPLLYYAPIFWGVPGEHFNDFMRFNPGEKEIFCETNPIPAMAEKNEAGIKKACTGNTDKSHPSSLPIAPLTQNPTTCVGPLTASIDDFSYDLEADHAEGPWPATTGCDALSFDPSLAANPTTTETDTASGLEVTLRVPQFQDPNTPSPSELKANTVTLPEGFSINPNAADGKASCSDAESAVGTEREAECPETSKVGTVSIDSSALPAPIDGFIYLGEPKPGEPYRLVLTANGFGTAVKLLGTIHADPADGAAGDDVRKPAADALPGIRPPLLRLRARHPRDPDPVRDIPGEKHVHALGRSGLGPEPDAILRPRPRPGRGAVPRSHPPLRPRLHRRKQ